MRVCRRGVFSSVTAALGIHGYERHASSSPRRYYDESAIPINPAEAPAYPDPRLFENLVFLCMSVLRRTEATRGQQQIRRSAGMG